MAYLEIETSEGIRRFPLNRDRVSIGRLSYNDIVLPSGQISRQHAEMRLINGEWWIADLHSTNGLHLGGRRIQQHRLRDGDRILLAPGITVSFSGEEVGSGALGATTGAAPSRQRPQSPPPAPLNRSAPPVFPPSQTPYAPPPAYDDPPTQQARPAPPPPPGRMPPQTPPPYPPLQARSVFADDEVPFAPNAPNGPNMPASPYQSAPGAPTWGNAGYDAGPMAARPTSGPLNAGYPVPRGPLHSGGEPQDPYRRRTHAPRPEPHGASAHALYVCPTCGQLTAPDAVYCQNCHNAIAHECVNCRLSLLPIQERCPRCQTPNAYALRRARPHAEGA